jgi:hypothetical protein
MNWKAFLQRVLLLLVGVALFLPVATIVVWALARVLATMGDAPGSGVLDRVALACVVLWVLDLVFLLLVQAIHLLFPPTDPPGHP